MFQYDCYRSKKLHKRNNSSDNDDSDFNNRDPGREVIEKNTRNRLQRIANQTKEELNIVLKRVDDTLNNYESSVQSSLIQHGMTHDDMSNVEHVADIKELENLLNDTLAKKRYQQRVMIFIVGQTEQLNEKTKLLEQIGQFFNEQKQSFSSKEFNISDEINETQNEFDQTLKSFDVKDCYVHVKELGTRLNELNEEIIEHLIQNAAAKQQAKGKKKSAQTPKETKEQLTNLQTKLDIANTEIINRDDKIQLLENEIQKNQNNQKILHDQLNQYEIKIKSYIDDINELENNIQQYQNQIDNSTNIKSITHHADANNTADTRKANLQKVEGKDDKSSNQTDKEKVQLTTVSDEIQTSDHSNEIIDHNEQILSNNIENLSDLNVLFNVNDGIDLNNVTNENLPTAFANLQQFATIRIKELLKEHEIKQSINNERLLNLQQEFDEYKINCEKEHNTLIKKADNAYQLQIEGQKASEETLNQSQLFINEQGKSKNNSVNQETQTEPRDTFENITSLPEHTNPIEELSNDRLSSHSTDVNEETESIKNLPQTSLIEEKQTEMDQIEQQVDIPTTSREEKIPLQSLENRTDNNDNEENQSVIKQDQQQSSSIDDSRRSSTHIEKMTTQMIPTDQFKLPFFHLYDIIYKFRHAIINLLDQNKFTSLADRLKMIQQLSSDNDDNNNNNNNITNDFIKNSECVLKDTVKILQTCITTLLSTIKEYQIKEKEIKHELEPIKEASLVDNQQTSTFQEKDLTIIDLTTKYEHITKVFNQTNKTYEEKLNQNQTLIYDQQKLIKNLRQELIHLQKRLEKIETEGIIEPSIMFTRLDAERNEQTLQQAVYKGKVHETTCNELNEAMTDYINLPSQQLSNLVKRYIQHRRAAEIEHRIENHLYDNETKNVLEKMELLYERRSNQISKYISDIRQQRANLARTLTEKFDYLEDESSIFLIRPVYSYRGRIAAQSYMKYEKLRREVLLKENVIKKQHHPSRQSLKSQSANSQKIRKQQIPTQISSISSSDDEEPHFYFEKSFVLPQTAPIDQQNDSTDSTIDTEQKPIKLNELSRLQEFDIQRALMPMSHVSTPLLSAFTNSGIDPCVPSLNLRSYVAVSRPGVGNARMRKPSEAITRISREDRYTISAKSHETNPRTPFNSSAGDLKRTSPPLPPIRRSLISNISSTTNEKQHGGFIPSFSTSEVSTTN
ncbi:unnamed protein product [Rotaria sordida]|uniref:Uncharacterized protein n=1 Tax=Rotaria sordida TaxID=392033 RepID=A0A814J9R5_9BILA|nr:unnamed protein product [Rotaria sordida]